MKVIFKKFEDKGGWKGRGSFMCDHNPNKEIQGPIVKFVMKCFKFNIFSKSKMEIQMEHNLSLNTKRKI